MGCLDVIASLVPCWFGQPTGFEQRISRGKLRRTWPPKKFLAIYMQNYRGISWDVLVISCAQTNLCSILPCKCQRVQLRGIGFSSNDLEVGWSVHSESRLMEQHCEAAAGGVEAAAAMSKRKRKVELLLDAPKCRCFGFSDPQLLWPFRMAGLALQAGGLGCTVLSVRSVWLWSARMLNFLMWQVWPRLPEVIFAENPFLVNSCSEPVRARVKKNDMHILRDFWFR